MDSLDSKLTSTRLAEMNGFGRTEIGHAMESLLGGERRRTFTLLNYGLAMVDDSLDTEPSEKYLTKIQKIFDQALSGVSVEASETEVQTIIDLADSLRKLYSGNRRDRAIAEHTRREVISYWEVEAKNLQRRWQVLGRENLDEISSNIGSLVASQLLFILDSPIDPYRFVRLAKAFGVAVKRADDLCDFKEDMTKGFINVPIEDIDHVEGIEIQDARVVRIDPSRFSLSREYILREYEWVEQAFNIANRLLLQTRLRRSIWNKKLDKRLCLFEQFCKTWLAQASEFVVSETRHKLVA